MKWTEARRPSLVEVGGRPRSGFWDASDRFLFTSPPLFPLSSSALALWARLEDADGTSLCFPAVYRLVVPCSRLLFSVSRETCLLGEVREVCVHALSL
jgi:hypothetical protein